ncbi:hypothetical protein CROQUDRAFT_132202 [Cronartium quercuum f. sp. fusiforme G11]|uniref:Uncharacterized protein n=1 Tax=Cronartium quercuum f. sp. fusiforme G11 TaxID=708437 RepID=A0A9P6TEM0_9BASI|nr:hypothetical protein CROQUDRAFT_132202 [Cronartium quercuum f. sp. fusiforme G11]
MKEIAEIIKNSTDGDFEINKELESVSKKIEGTQKDCISSLSTETDPEAIMLQNITQFILNRLALHQEQTTERKTRPLFVGLQASHGIDKTMITQRVSEKLKAEPYNLNLMLLSLEDFYLTSQQQTIFESRYPNNVLLKEPGLPGTHDIELLQEILRSLEEINKLPLPQTILIPRYDKLTKDRKELETIEFYNSIHIVILEGWMIGFKPLLKSDLKQIFQKRINLEMVRNLLKEQKTYNNVNLKSIKTYLIGNQFKFISQINILLFKYQNLIWNKIDILIQIKPNNYDFIKNWKLEEGNRMKPNEETTSSNTKDEIISELSRYMASYELYNNRFSIRPHFSSNFNVLEIILNQIKLPVKITISSDLELSEEYLTSDDGDY